MLIEQIIKFELRDLGFQVVHVIVQFTLKTGYFHDKIKNFQGKSSSELLFAAKIMQ